jgi:hypothetical protein
MTSYCRCLPAVLAAILLLPAIASAQFSFTRGHYYATRENNFGIRQYDAAGQIVGTLIAPQRARGLAFGKDGLLYVTVIPTGDDGFRVEALDASGLSHRTYSGSDYFYGDTGAGMLALDDTYLYVAGANKLTRFQIDNPSVRQVISNLHGINDVEVLPSGNLLVGSSFGVAEMTSSGTVLRNIPLDSGGGPLEFDPAGNAIFVFHTGTSGSTITGLLKFDYTTLQVLGSADLTAGDLFFTSSGQLLLSSPAFTTTVGPRLFSTNFQLNSTFSGDNRGFVTQLVPEPSSLLPLLLAVVLARRRSTSRSVCQRRAGRALA